MDPLGKAVGGNALIEQRIAAAPGLSTADGHALAGFLDAEGSSRSIRTTAGVPGAAADAAGAQDSMHADMAADAAALRVVRRYVNSPPPARDGPLHCSRPPSFEVASAESSTSGREAAEERAFALLANRRWDCARVARAAARLSESRAHRGPRQPPGTGGQDGRSAREAYLVVLRAFAAERPDGALTCTAYAQARAGHPEWPTRNTLALAFGTWAQALAAAGLGSRTSRWQRVGQKRARPRE